MHIPDGYMAPETTIPVLIGMAPVWAVAAKKVKEKVGEKNLPTLALGAAFSFTIMMMNVPVAGGSSAHSVGAVLIAIMLGPWAATIAVSSALLIQALVFGDGGVLAFGMNCLNMAVVMPFVGYGVYRLICGKNSTASANAGIWVEAGVEAGVEHSRTKSTFGSSRSIIAAAIAGFMGLNAAALLAAVEFGIQPMLFTGADGAALYCPYPLSVSIPAMMFAHILVAGPIEGVVTGAAIAYIAKAAPQMFITRAAGADAAADVGASRVPGGSPANAVTNGKRQSFLKRYKALLIPLGVLVALTPLGLIAQGTAWGEWGTDEIKKTLGYVPSGFASMADWWRSILPDYTVKFFGNGAAGSITGYVISAVAGILLIAGLILALSLFVRKSKKGTAREQTR